MKIAVATSDGKSVSQHFGRSAGFVVFNVDGKKIIGQEYRTNQATPHAQGLCRGEHEHEGHNHAGIVALLQDCEVVLCGGMGARAAEALTQQGVKPVVLPVAGSVEDALAHYLRDQGRGAAAAFCACQH